MGSNQVQICRGSLIISKGRQVFALMEDENELRKFESEENSQKIKPKIAHLTSGARLILIA